MKKPKAAAKDKPSTDQPEDEYKPTPREQEAIKAFVASREARKLSSRLTVKKAASGAFTIGLDHKDPFTGQMLLMQALGVTDFDFVASIIGQVSNAASKGGAPSEEDANFMLSVMCSIEPKDQVEVMLAAQMAAVHMATMTFARRLANVGTVPQQDSAERALNKLARTFTTQIEALKRYRSTGQQKVTVEHVTVQAGGQAIVGNVSHGTPSSEPTQQPPALASPNEAPLPLTAGGGALEEKVRATSWSDATPLKTLRGARQRRSGQKNAAALRPSEANPYAAFTAPEAERLKGRQTGLIDMDCLLLRLWRSDVFLRRS